MIRCKFSSFFTCFLSVISLFFINCVNAQYISTNSSYTADQLVKDIFIGAKNASCITVDNISVSGWDFGSGDLSYGYFNKNGSAFEVDEGVILSSGRVSEAVGIFTGIQSSTASGWAGDRDLEVGAGINNTTNATILEFDFTSNQSDKISFDYMFLSEQYLRNDDPGTCGYTDGFAFLIKKIGDLDYTNIAVIPGTSTPITSNNVRGAGGKCPAINDAYFGHYNPDGSPVSFNGQTAILTAKTDVVPGQKYHIKLVIADQGNGLYDSGVFLRAGSFTGNIDLGPDLTLENAEPLCAGSYHDITTIPGASSYRWFRNGIPIPGTDDIDTYRATQEGDYRVDIILSSGCKLEGKLRIEDAPVANVDTTPIQVCDSDFDGKYSAILSDFNSEIVTNFSRDFKISYYTTSGTLIDPDKEFTFTSNPQTINVSVGAFSCTPKIYPVQFYYGTQLNVNFIPVYPICDSELSGGEDINLADYVALITNETGVMPTYFATEAQAKTGGSSNISSLQTISTDKSFFIRIEKVGFCPNYKEVKFNFKQPNKSTTLPDDPIIICKGATTTLDAGIGFTSYEWSNGETTQDIKNVPAGDYWVKLTSNGCTYQQFVKVSEALDPVIDNVLIEGTTVTILVSGGTAPYQYALDGGSYQSSNVFSNVDLGNHTVYVQDVNGCSVINKDFSLINIQNIISPNHDGFNDVIDYSSLLSKLEPRFEVYDRNGVLVFKGDTKNQFVWDGTFNGRMLPTSTYWYIIEWNESGNPQRTQLTGWILLKNRN